MDEELEVEPDEIRKEIRRIIHDFPMILVEEMIEQASYIVAETDDKADDLADTITTISNFSGGRIS
jgi:hypothetical protein